ncbi:Fic family protein [Oleiagrimonas sp. MCCC 1A03011]|uniref:Fic family protein n=1 Tax=Oleiagrimonas sp. MCCC 1A03011 TaxID=1926883 RepID=UPI000DC3AFA6|nr:Fic family protein [Oleiagrimonas sp. MCCC 1A03011]RAP57238.1 hypothetical protein BTJ49_11895 [Oleiagrimonas sp. MCCC 1A03011]
MYVKIKNLTPQDNKLTDNELNALGRVWKERKGELVERGEFKEFLKKLQREWAIETGIIERLYSWDRGVTEVLIEQGVDASLISHKGGLTRETAEHVNDIIRDQLDIVEGLFSHVKGEQPLTEHFIRGLQNKFTAHQKTTEALNSEGNVIQVNIRRGEYKKLPNNPRRRDGTMHVYCPPELVDEEMGNLIAWYREAEGHTSPEVLSAWLHHRFTQIHPFQDGNGRVARALASLVFLKAEMFPLVVRDADRTEYIGALENADDGDLSSLVKLFSRRQRSSVLSAIGLEQQVQQQRFAEEIISSALQVLKSKFQTQKHEVDGVYKLANNLQKKAGTRLSAIAEKLDHQLKTFTPPGKCQYHANARTADNDSAERHYFYAQIINIANIFDYFANLNAYRSWSRLAISTEHIFELVISIHGYGSGRNGVLAATAFTFQRVATEEQGSEFVNIRACTPEIFQFNYAEATDSIEQRFDDWVESACAIALSEWKRLIDS